MDIRYIAGLMDADGHITIRKVNSRVFIVVIGFTNCHKPVVQEFANRFGGSIHYMNQSVKKPHHRPTWGWKAGNQIANHFLQLILPHLIIKKADAEIALKMQESINTFKSARPGRRGGPSAIPSEVLEQRQRWHDECKANKHIQYL